MLNNYKYFKEFKQVKEVKITKYIWCHFQDLNIYCDKCKVIFRFRKKYI